MACIQRARIQIGMCLHCKYYIKYNACCHFCAVVIMLHISIYIVHDETQYQNNYCKTYYVSWDITFNEFCDWAYLRKSNVDKYIKMSLQVSLQICML